MPHDLCILVCPYFEKEIRKISSGAGLENAVLDVYPSECGGPPPAPPSGEGSLNRPSECGGPPPAPPSGEGSLNRPSECGGPPPEWKEIAAIVSKYPECKAVRILGSRCLRKLKNPPENLRHCRIHPLNHCFHMFADSSVIDDYIRRGYYLMTPGILQQWRKKIQQGDFDRKDTGKFSGGNFSALLLADTLVCPDIPLHLETFADVVGRPFEILPAGTDFFRLFLSEIRLQWLLEQEKKQSQQALNQAREQTAEYALAMDMLKNLSLKKNEDEAIGDIMDIFTMLFAPGEISYLSVNDGSPGKIFRSASGSSSDEAELRDRLMKLDQDYAWTESESGWRLRIRCRNQILGILEADRLAFPEHRKRYLDLAITVAGICGLVIENARIYRNILLMNRDLEKARVLAEEGKRAKSEFIANMSHEIRTPLNAILGFADIMDKKIRDEQLRDYLANIRSGGKALLVLLNDILELSKIESGKMPISCGPVSVPDIFREIRILFMPQVSEKGLRFFLDTAADIPRYLLLDHVRIRQILWNLVGNAVRFTDSGYIRISVRTGDCGNAAETTDLIFSVEDTGIGIPPEKRSSIFNVFEQQPGQDQAKYGGTGLGLSITKRLVEMMNGKISVSGKKGRGSIFRVKLNHVRIVRGYNMPSEKEPPREKISDQCLLPVENKENNASCISDPEILRQLPELICLLQNIFLPQWKEISDILIMDDIMKFASDLDGETCKYSIPFLKNYCLILQKYVKNYDITGTKRQLGCFPEILEKVRKLMHP